MFLYYKGMVVHIFFGYAITIDPMYYMYIIYPIGDDGAIDSIPREWPRMLPLLLL